MNFDSRILKKLSFIFVISALIFSFNTLPLAEAGNLQSVNVAAAPLGEWQFQQSLPDTRFFSKVRCFTSVKCVAVGGQVIGQNGRLVSFPRIFTTSDGGITWNHQKEPATEDASLTVLTCVKEGVCLSVYFHDIIKSEDYGRTWKTSYYFQSAVINNISCFNSNSCFAIGSENQTGQGNGAIYFSNDGAASWKQVYTVPHPDPYHAFIIDCPSTIVCYASFLFMDYSANNNKSSILKTSDGGKSWNTQGKIIPFNLVDITCPTVATCYAVGSNYGGKNVIYVTKDGGITWETQNSGRDNGLFGVSCVSEVTCLAIGEGAFISTTNGGISWEQQKVINPGYGLSSISCLVNVEAIPHCVAVGGGASVATFSSQTKINELCQTFVETGFEVCGRFLEYWKANGGLTQQGFPISNVFEEKNADPPAGDGKVHKVQYFQRARFEEHLENYSPFDVLLGLLGTEQYKSKYERNLPQVQPQLPGNCQSFAETGFQVCGRFLEYWNTNGGLAQQGLPISNIFEELNAPSPAGDGKIHRVQYFQRARFEEHSENQRPFDVLLGLIATEQYLNKQKS